MNVIVAADYEDLSAITAKIIAEKVRKNPRIVLGLATGSTPLGTYNELVEAYQQKQLDFSQVSSLNLDEYIGLDPDHPQSYHVFMKKHLFNHINIDEKNTFIPDGLAANLHEECRRYEEIISQIGPPDLQLLGIGENGHIGFNEPGTPFNSFTHIVDLAASTREANARFFHSFEEVPNQAITMGIGSILRSSEILLLASGKRKAAAIKRLLKGETDEQFPASVLSEHPNVTLIVDEDAYQET
ncbi:glucosamine-6-phosphate deaminase [Halobacillus salinarum]|uniref:Glucosamine-6-phosphate deaminase n=1 Tax=Halobacillus salinarum TaxID=2932257 RepID=A0ABY4EFN6_9BACI|nr:glucosamine-6-phosphate deaminase [Halobacillus salinarum]UOQ43275.1 glucosamine-6-phosphate deaminase [Halobacillus salinarum]